jgi:copper chaperone CopZ
MRLSALVALLFALVFVSGCAKSGSMQTENATSLEQIEAEAAAAGPLEPNTAVMWVYGMGCPQCAYNVDVQLLKVKGVEGVKLDMLSGKVVAQLSPDNPPTEAQLTKAIKNTGFTLVKIQMPQS